MSKTYDFIIIGAGVVGCMVARELSRYKTSVLLLEKENDVSSGASKANSGIVHGGYDAKSGTLKSKLVRKGNRMFAKLNNELNFGYRECGSLVLAFDQDELDKLHELKENGCKNGVDDLVILNRAQVIEMEPSISQEVLGALYCKTSGVTSPYELTIALVENAVSNGVQLKLKSEVKSIEKTDDGFIVFANEAYKCKYVINCAGVYSDQVAKMVGAENFRIIPRRGEYILLNKNQGKLANHVLFQTPTNKGKGILVTRTYHGNLMLGPNAQEISQKEEVSTNKEILAYIVSTARKSVPNFNIKMTLNSFSGIRATSDRKDFIIEESIVKGFINVGGIDSPGLTSSPAIALRVIDIIQSMGVHLQNKDDFGASRRSIIIQKDQDFNGVIDHDDPAKNIICRCEKVTESEIVDAIHRGIPIDSLDAIKRRTRAGMGPCQGAFCGKRVASIISRETGLAINEITPRGKGSSILPHREDRNFYRDLD